jgi:hypothetical protein
MPSRLPGTHSPTSCLTLTSHIPDNRPIFLSTGRELISSLPPFRPFLYHPSLHHRFPLRFTAGVYRIIHHHVPTHPSLPPSLVPPSLRPSFLPSNCFLRLPPIVVVLNETATTVPLRALVVEREIRVPRQLLPSRTLFSIRPFLRMFFPSCAFVLILSFYSFLRVPLLLYTLGYTPLSPTKTPNIPGPLSHRSSHLLLSPFLS